MYLCAAAWADEAKTEITSNINEPLHLNAKNLFGKNEEIKISGKLEEGQRRLRIGLINPDILSSDLFMENYIWAHGESDIRYHLQRCGTEAFLGKRTGNFKNYLGVRYEQIRTYHLQENITADITNSRGRKYSASCSLISERSTLDNLEYPYSGTWTQALIERGTEALGSSYDFVRMISEWRRYKTIDDKTIVLRAKSGWVTEAAGANFVPFFERFYVGGTNTVRGYSGRRLGVMDNQGLPVGGDFIIVLNAELRFPLYKKLKGAVFFDTGNNWEKPRSMSLRDFKSAAGVGLRYLTSWTIVRLDAGLKLDPEPSESAGNVHLTLGLPF